METSNNQELIRLSLSPSNPLMTVGSPHRGTDCWHALGFPFGDFAQADTQLIVEQRRLAVTYRMVSISASRATWVAEKPLMVNFLPLLSEKWKKRLMW